MDYNDFILSNAGKFPSEDLPILRQHMAAAPKEAQYPVMTAAYKEPVLAFVLSFFLGTIGIDRFYVGDIGLGVGKLCATIFTFGIVGGVWWFVDLFLIMKAAKRKNFESAMRILSYAGAGSAQPAAPQPDDDSKDKDDDSSDFDDF